ncbi:hypothetical protein GALL_395150 [mine drainage metagenome]|uniref:Uncharacterized protein n=1 Tax=mine drainage metagenome TaxID=410659 RepID=A0A1J5Q506_9ZZZZ
MYEHRAPLDVPQELQAEALALARPGDQPGDVGDGEPRVARLHDSEVGHQSRERVVGDLRSCGRHRGDEARLPGAREPDQGDVRDRLELEHEVLVQPRLAEKGEARRLAARRRERGVAEAAVPPGSHDVARAHADEVGEDGPVEVLDDRALRDGQLEVGAGRSLAVVTHALGTGRRMPVRPVVVVQQRRGLRVHDEDHAPAVAAVAAVRTGEGLELLAVDGGATVATVTAGGVQHDPVDERRHGFLLHTGAAWATPGTGGGAHRTGAPLRT